MAKTLAKKVVLKTDSEADRIAKIAASVVAAVVTETQKPILSIIARQTKTLGQIAAAQESLMKRLDAKDGEIEAGDEEIEADGDDMDSKAKPTVGDQADDEDDADDEDGEEGDEDEVEADAGGVDKGDLEDLGTAEGDERPGHHNNDDLGNKGSKTAVEDKVGPTVSAAKFKALEQKVAALTSRLDASNKVNDKLLKKVTKQEEQLTAAAARTVRRSLDPQIVALLGKHQVDANDLVRSGEKLSVSEVDAVLASAEKDGVRLSPTDRITIKNKMVDNGLMDEGRVDRRSVR